MNRICAIALDEDKTFLSFANLKRSNPDFFKIVEVSLPYKNNSSIADHLQDNLAVIDQKIREVEISCSCRILKVFVELPWNLSKQRLVEEIVILKRRKIVTPKDILFAKKYLEDKFLDWDDFCLHNIVMNYEIDTVAHEKPPLGIWAKKIKLTSHLLWVKDKLYKEVEDLFYTLDRSFGGFVAAGISMFATSFRKRAGKQVMISVGFSKSYSTVVDKGKFIFGKEFDFGIKKIIEEIGRRFLLKYSLSEEVFNRYVSFKEIPYNKEITIKKEDTGCINLSIQVVNSVVKEYVKREIVYFAKEIEDNICNNDFSVSFIGRLNSKEGFFGFLKEYVGFPGNISVKPFAVSSSMGCLRYGVSRFLENDYKQHGFFIQRFINIYREYF